MRISVVAAVACAAAAAAHDDFDSIYQPSKGEIVQVGSTVEIKWNVLTNVDGPVNITLSAGADGDSLDLVDTLASGYDNSKLTYSWKVKSPAKEHKAYGIQIVLASNASVYSWSPGFAIKDEAPLSSTSSIKSGDTSSSLHTSTGTTTLSSHSSSSTATDSTISAPTTASPTEQASATSDTNSAAKSTSSSGASALGAGSFAAVGGLVAALLAV